MDDGGATASLGFGFGVTRAPDGSMYVTCTIHTSATSFTFGIPQEQALTWVKDFGDNWRAAQAEAKREASGLVFPKNGSKLGGLIDPRQG